MNNKLSHSIRAGIASSNRRPRHVLSALHGAVCGRGLRALCLWLAALAWPALNSSATAQTLVTNGCLILTYQPNQTNSVCGTSYVFTDPGITIVSNLCPDAVLPPFGIRCQPPLGTSLGLGVRSISCQIIASNASIAAGWQFTITVKSTLDPAVILCPTNQVLVIPCESNCAPATYALPEVINGTLIECWPPSGSCFAPGLNSVTCRATNTCGDSSSCVFNIRVTREAPFDMQQCPTNRVLFIPCTSGCVPVEYPLPMVTNGAPVSCTPPPGTCFPVGFNSVVCRATNDCGDRLACGFMIRVVSELPVIQCPTNSNQLITFISCFNAPCGTHNYPLPTVTNGTLVGCTPPPGTCFPAGNSTVTCHATNDCGELRECSFTVEVRRDPGPRFQEPFHGGIFTNQCGSNCIPVFYRIPLVSNGALQGCIPPPGTCLPVGIHPVGCRATNSCSYNSTYFEVRVVQGTVEPPAITCPTNHIRTISCATSNCVQVDYELPTVANGTLEKCTPPPGTCFPVGVTWITCLATNDCGERTACPFNVRVLTPPPIILCPTSELMVGGPSCNASNYCVPVDYPLPEVVGGTLVSCTPPPGTCFAGNPNGGSLVHPVVCRATNDCGTLAECSFSIRVIGEPRYGPRIQCPLPNRVFTNQCSSPCTPVSYPLPEVGFGSLSGCHPPPGTCLPVGVYQVTCTGRNLCGTDSCSFQVRVVQGRPSPPSIRIVRREELLSLYWEDECGSIGLLETSNEPDGPWEVITGASPGYPVDPSKFKQFFRVTITE